MKRNDIGNIDEWTLKERIRLDNSKNLVNRYSRTKVLPCSNVKWCDWKTSEWNECNKFCGSGMKQRQVFGERQFSCNPAVKPFTYTICNNGECKNICESKFKKWTNVKSSLTEAKFINNIYCATKAKINQKELQLFQIVLHVVILTPNLLKPKLVLMVYMDQIIR